MEISDWRGTTINDVYMIKIKCKISPIGKSNNSLYLR